jgi:hypothetical protein
MAKICLKLRAGLLNRDGGVQDLLDIKFSSNMYYDTISTYDNTSIPSLIFNYTATSVFYMYKMFTYDTTYNTFIVASLNHG